MITPAPPPTTFPADDSAPVPYSGEPGGGPALSSAPFVPLSDERKAQIFPSGKRGLAAALRSLTSVPSDTTPAPSFVSAPAASITSAAPVLAPLPPPEPPTRSEVKAHLDAFIASESRSTVPATRHAATLARMVAHGTYVEPADRDDATHAVVVAVAKSRATDAQIVELLMASMPGATENLLARVAAARAQVDGAAEELRWARAGEYVGEPHSDADVRARLLPGPRNEGVRSCGSNIELVLRYSSALRGHLRFNELTKGIEISGGPFADTKPSDLPVKIANWLETEWQIFSKPQVVGEQLLALARSAFGYHPVKEYLSGLAWDGKPRIDSWLTTYCGADDSEYTRRVGGMFLIAAVARAHAALPDGAKVDTVLVLEGEQGVGKSQTLGILGGAFFCDTPVSIGDKDGRLLIGRCWIAELAELASLAHSMVESQKAFLSQKDDWLRPPYGRVIEQFVRTGIFAGTMNPTSDGAAEYLEDETGNRRWWGVRCHGLPTGRVDDAGEPVREIDLAGLRRDRDQLWAEAVVRFRRGERWWFETHEKSIWTPEADKRRKADAWVPLILEYYEQRVRAEGPSFRGIKLDEVAGRLDIPRAMLPSKSKAVGRSLRAAGLRSTHAKGGNLWSMAGEPSEPSEPAPVMPMAVCV